MTCLVCCIGADRITRELADIYRTRRTSATCSHSSTGTPDKPTLGVIDVLAHSAKERTYLAAGRPVEIADIVLVGDRYQVEYRFPVD